MGLIDNRCSLEDGLCQASVAVDSDKVTGKNILGGNSSRGEAIEVNGVHVDDSLRVGVLTNSPGAACRACEIIDHGASLQGFFQAGSQISYYKGNYTTIVFRVLGE